jgi:hypothetical protein
MMTMLAKTKYATDKFALSSPSRTNPYFAGTIRQVQAHFAEFRDSIFLSLFVRFFGCDDAAMCRVVLIIYNIPRFVLNFTDQM